ncbi:hypothetical protein DEO72_LG3g1869 [Vigna unguiculata]|uniref:Uncharacterized protein n=1 Tax=Vigna unguiculata TaxID=3917 RepID=A0A4D6LG89_VIGUN|nr:hypothetical protein DEO72_LG3g1869 [Vigna unguiculata]
MGASPCTSTFLLNFLFICASGCTPNILLPRFVFFIHSLQAKFSRICQILRNNLQHPNEYIRDITLRFRSSSLSSRPSSPTSSIATPSSIVSSHNCNETFSMPSSSHHERTIDEAEAAMEEHRENTNQT